MKTSIIWIIVILSFVILPFCQPSNAADLTLNNTPTQVYSFTSPLIAKALLNAHRRGVKVDVVLDQSLRTDKYTSATFLANSGIPTYLDDKHAIADNRVMIIDQETVITGSFNFTKAAENKNAENLLIIKDKKPAKEYLENWYKHRGHSEVYKRK
jgi:phosphatidylserine/phosphatidylglycerophosphate/cardiolipin synthase-like enzyme